MNIYLISQTANDGYDTYDAAVVIAESASKARLMHPFPEYHRLETWVAPDLVSVQFIGTTESCDPKVILASFNAG